MVIISALKLHIGLSCLSSNNRWFATWEILLHDLFLKTGVISKRRVFILGFCTLDLCTYINFSSCSLPYILSFAFRSSCSRTIGSAVCIRFVRFSQDWFLPRHTHRASVWLRGYPTRRGGGGLWQYATGRVRLLFEFIYTCITRLLARNHPNNH